MKPLKKIAALAVVLICVLSFIKKEKQPTTSTFNLESINIEDVLAKHQFECRPSSDFVFYVETDIVKKIRGANNINAKVFILDKATGRKNLLAQENLQVKKYDDAIAIKDHSFSNDNQKNTVLVNGDKIIGGSGDAPYSFNELVKYDAIYNSYIHSTNKLLRLKRSI